eukprot:6709041-Ditylum_brightwellii.AAC.1
MQVMNHFQVTNTNKEAKRFTAPNAALAGKQCDFVDIAATYTTTCPFSKLGTMHRKMRQHHFYILPEKALSIQIYQTPL